MTKRTKIETVESKQPVLGGFRYFATIKEVYVDSGKTKRIVCKLDAGDRPSLMWQLEGAMQAIMGMREPRQPERDR
jgi:hypothetical protein